MAESIRPTAFNRGASAQPMSSAFTWPSVSPAERAGALAGPRWECTASPSQAEPHDGAVLVHQRDHISDGAQGGKRQEARWASLPTGGLVERLGHFERRSGPRQAGERIARAGELVVYLWRVRVETPAAEDGGQ